VDFCCFGVELLDDAPDVVDRVTVEQTGQELDDDRVSYLVGVLGGDVTVAD
jgi:hypothetical protein